MAPQKAARTGDCEGLLQLNEHLLPSAALLFEVLAIVRQHRCTKTFNVEERENQGEGARTTSEEGTSHQKVLVRVFMFMIEERKVGGGGETNQKWRTMFAAILKRTFNLRCSRPGRLFCERTRSKTRQGRWKNKCKWTKRISDGMVQNCESGTHITLEVLVLVFVHHHHHLNRRAAGGGRRKYMHLPRRHGLRC
jgi:hypothetical protein